MKSLNESLQDEIETKNLYNEVKDKYDIYHLNVISTHTGRCYAEDNVKSFAEIIGEQNVSNVTVGDITDKIVNIIKDFAILNQNNEFVIHDENNTISW